MKKRDDGPDWSAMSNIQRAEYIQGMVKNYPEGKHYDKLILQIEELRTRSDKNNIKKT